jgi:hypothetical protein
MIPGSIAILKNYFAYMQGSCRLRLHLRLFIRNNWEKKLSAANNAGKLLWQ